MWWVRELMDTFHFTDMHVWLGNALLIFKLIFLLVLEWDDPHSLVVLAEEEIVVLDLHDENWSPYKAPYLSSLHSSAVTCAQHSSNIPDGLWKKLIEVGELQLKEPCSGRVSAIFSLFLILSKGFFVKLWFLSSSWHFLLFLINIALYDLNISL